MSSPRASASLRETPSGGFAAGVGAALRTPAWLRDLGWTQLMHGAPDARADAAAPDDAVRAALLAIRVLGRVPGGRWRNTCLYRAVAECLVLRRYGVDARLRIGVGTEGAEVIAHAWVVRGDQPDAAADPAAAALSPLAFRA